MVMAIGPIRVTVADLLPVALIIEQMFALPDPRGSLDLDGVIGRLRTVLPHSW